MPLDEQQQQQQQAPPPPPPPPPPQQQQQSTEPRRKRAKIVSACGECRRKKTKCNGESPCRNCEKSGVPCIYPSSSSNDDKRNGPSKAALEAIEDRLKTIEDMLRTIIKSQNILSTVDMDPVVNNFLNNTSNSTKSSSSSVISSPPPYQQQQQHHQQQHMTSYHNTNNNLHYHQHSLHSLPQPNSPPLSTSSINSSTNNNIQNRLPSICSLSSSEALKHENNRDILPPPVGFQNYGYHHQQPKQQCKYEEENEDVTKKRKR